MTERKLQEGLTQIYRTIGGKGSLKFCNIGTALFEFVSHIAKMEIKSDYESRMNTRFIQGIVDLQRKRSEVAELKRILDDIQWRIVTLEEKLKDSENKVEIVITPEDLKKFNTSKKVKK
jgi:apolipoprotein N-acyltransferase